MQIYLPSRKTRSRTQGARRLDMMMMSFVVCWQCHMMNKKRRTFVSPLEREALSVDEKKWLCAKKNECGQKKMSVLRVSVSVECGVWTLDYESAVSGEPPKISQAGCHEFLIMMAHYYGINIILSSIREFVITMLNYYRIDTTRLHDDKSQNGL